MLKLSKRLLTLARHVPADSRLGDIGTDHALLPIYLITEKVASLAIAVDVHLGPYHRAREKVQEYNLSNKIDVRLGNGLDPLTPGEVDVVIIAGMGGSNIRDILDNSLQHRPWLKKLIMQPMQDSQTLRMWLQGNEWYITHEDIILEDGRLFEVITAEKGREMPLTEAELAYGPLLLRNKHPLLIPLLAREEKGVQEILRQLEKSNRIEALEKIQEFKMRMIMIKELQEWLSAVEQ